MTSLLLPWCLVAALAACSAPPAAPPRAQPQDRPTATAAPIASQTAAPAAPLPSAQPEAPPPIATFAATFHREVEAAVTSIALEEPPYAAALGAKEAWIHDARGWRAEPLPASARPGDGAEATIFYGRDHRTRIMGLRAGGGETRSIYLREFANGIRPEKAEIGRLANPVGGLVGVLGPADPEIVCRPGDACIIKRRTGWATIAAPPDIRRVALGAGVGWAVAGKQLLRLDREWQSAGPPGAWESADALFATGDRAWVIETARGRVHAFDGSNWQVTPSPIAAPRAGHAASATSVWLVGDGGLARFDGKTWSLARDAPTPLRAVLGRSSGDVWVGGDRGLFRVEAASPAR